MQFLFDPNSKFMQFLSRFADIVVLNVVFLLTCLPVFTIGAALTAMYDTVFRMDTEREEKLLRTYWGSLKRNFRQGTVIWLLLLLFGAASCVNMAQFSDIGGTLGYVLFLFAMLVLIVALLVLSYAFPLLSQFRNSTLGTLKNALLLSIAHLPRSLLILGINCFPWALMVLNLYAFIRLGFLWFSLYFAAAAYFNSRVLNKVLQPYWENG